MSVNIYLKPEIKNAPEFRTKTHKDGSQGLQFDGMALYSDKGRLHVMLNEWDIVPPVLEEFVTDVSIRVTAPCESFRREGSRRPTSSPRSSSVTRGRGA